MSRRRPIATPKAGWSLGGSEPAAPQRQRGAPGGGAALPPSGNTGGKSRDDAKAIVDWLRFTFVPVGSIGDALEQVRRYLKLWSDMPMNLVPSKAGFRGYSESHDVMTFLDGEWMRVGIVACGGANVGHTILVDLTGKGCAVVTSWDAVYATMQDLDARITRCDLAMDFLHGEVTVSELDAMYGAGEFNCGGRIPTYRRIESGTAATRGSGGTTLEIGRRGNGKMVRAYEKGRQLGNVDSEWVRVEIEFGSKDRVIPHEIVLRTDHYFVGAHKALERFIDVAALRCRTDQVERETTLETAKRAIRTQYGKVINQALIDNGEDFAALVVDVRQEGVPPRMQKSALAMHVHGAHEPAPIQRE